METNDGAPTSRSGVALVLVSAACFGALGVLTQLAYRAGVSVLGLICGRYVVAAAALWLLVRVLRRPLPSCRGVLLGLGLGAGYSVQALLFAASLKHLQAGFADLLYFAYPAMVAIGAAVLRREPWSRRRGAALLTASAGIGLALTGGSSIDLLGVALALAAAFGYAAYVIASSSLLKGIDPLVLAALLCTAAAVVLSPDALAHGELTARVGVDGVLFVVTAALVSTVLGIGAFLTGVRRLGPSRASIVSSVEPALTAAFGFALFGDRLGPVQALGAGLVFASVPILELRQRAANRSEPHGAVAQPPNPSNTYATGQSPLGPRCPPRNRSRARALHPTAGSERTPGRAGRRTPGAITRGLWLCFHTDPDTPVPSRVSDLATLPDTIGPARSATTKRRVDDAPQAATARRRERQC